EQPRPRGERAPYDDHDDHRPGETPTLARILDRGELAAYGGDPLVAGPGDIAPRSVGGRAPAVGQDPRRGGEWRTQEGGEERGVDQKVPNPPSAARPNDTTPTTPSVTNTAIRAARFGFTAPPPRSLRRQPRGRSQDRPRPFTDNNIYLYRVSCNLLRPESGRGWQPARAAAGSRRPGYLRTLVGSSQVGLGGPPARPVRLA